MLQSEFSAKAMNTSKRGRKVEEREEISLVYTLPDNPDRPTSKINSFTISLASAEGLLTYPSI